MSILKDVTADKNELNLLDTAQVGVVVPSKAVIYSAAGDVKGTTVTATGAMTAGGSLTATGALTAGTGSSIGNLTLGNGSITDSSAAISFGNNTLTTSGDMTAKDVTVTGILTVSGTTTTVNSINVTVQDPLMVLSSGATSGAVDAGLIVNRGTDDNVGMIWNETSDHFEMITTTNDGTTAGRVPGAPAQPFMKNPWLTGIGTFSNVQQMMGARGFNPPPA